MLDAGLDGLIVFRVARDDSGDLLEASLEYLNAAADAWWRLQHPAPGTYLVLDRGQDEVLGALVTSVALNGQPQRLRVHQSPELGGRGRDVHAVRDGSRGRRSLSRRHAPRR